MRKFNLAIILLSAFFLNACSDGDKKEEIKPLSGLEELDLDIADLHSKTSLGEGKLQLSKDSGSEFDAALDMMKSDFADLPSFEAIDKDKNCKIEPIINEDGSDSRISISGDFCKVIGTISFKLTKPTGEDSKWNSSIDFKFYLELYEANSSFQVSKLKKVLSYHKKVTAESVGKARRLKNLVYYKSVDSVGSIVNELNYGNIFRSLDKKSIFSFKSSSKLNTSANTLAAEYRFDDETDKLTFGYSRVNSQPANISYADFKEMGLVKRTVFSAELASPYEKYLFGQLKNR